MTEREGQQRSGGTAAERRALTARLRAEVRGEIADDAATRALHTMDASNYRRVPLAVAAPRDAADIAAVLGVCRELEVPVVPRGGGTSIAGQATGTGVVLDLTRHMNALLDLDPAAGTAVVQPGLVLDRLQEAAAPHGLRFGPDPSTHARCTLGGMIGNNSCGSHSVAWGTTADSVRTLDVLTADGTTRRLARGWDGAPDGLRALVDQELALLRTGFPELPRRISGYALDALLPENGTQLARFFCGSEGTLGVLTEAEISLVRPPRSKALLVLGYADEAAAAEAAPALLPYGPLTVEGMAADLVTSGAGELPRGGAWLFVEVGGESPAEAQAHARRLLSAADTRHHLLVTDPAGQRALWRIREDASGTATRSPDGKEAWPGWEDCAVPPARLAPYLREFRTLLAEHGLHGTPYGHFGDGCIHIRIDFDLVSPQGVRSFRLFSEELARLVTAHGGSLSGEHGDGQARAELLPVMYGQELVDLFGKVKSLFDPGDILNPGILVRPEPLDANLRFAVLPRRPVDVAFGYPEDGGDFTAAVRRCVGVAKCRDTTAGPNVMCPSFRATGEEQHSTRGRARLLHEMLAGGRGGVVTDGWRSEEVRGALDLCLSCKGCRSDCPVGVDMATYKAEFLHQHYRGRLRPAAHYALGMLPRWLGLATRLGLSRLLDRAARRPWLAALAKRLAGIAPERDIPRLAPRTFTRWWREEGAEEFTPCAAGGDHDNGPVRAEALLWPDTFTEYLAPETGQSAVRVLADAGIGCLVPEGVCCGLTYVSTGQLDRARKVMTRTLDRIAPALATGAPVVVLEPSCAAALRTDLPELLSDDPRARRLASAVRTFAEALAELAPDWRPPRIGRPVVGQTHCHQHAVLGDEAERRLREQAGLEGELSSGCCGLAGNFGFERGHEEVSRACAEEQLLPSVRRAPEDAVVLADGYSCRTQLAQLAGVRGAHLAEVLGRGVAERERGVERG